jgi:hypothetical protein
MHTGTGNRCCRRKDSLEKNHEIPFRMSLHIYVRYISFYLCRFMSKKVTAALSMYVYITTCFINYCSFFVMNRGRSNEPIITEHFPATSTHARNICHGTTRSNARRAKVVPLDGAICSLQRGDVSQSFIQEDNRNCSYYVAGLVDSSTQVPYISCPPSFVV